MRAALLVASALLAGCYSPRFTECVLCGQGEACPSGSACVDGYCQGGDLPAGCAPAPDAGPDADGPDAAPELCETLDDGETIDLPAVTVTLQVTVNGSPVPDRGLSGYGDLVLHDRASGDEFPAGTTDAPKPTSVLKGTYDVHYLHGTTGPGAVVVPANSVARIASDVSLTTSGVVSLDIHTVLVDRSVTVNGSPVPDPHANGSGSLSLRDNLTGGSVSLGTTHAASHPERLVAGTYDVMYTSGDAGSGGPGVEVTPRGSGRILAAVDLESAVTLPINIPTITVDRTFRVNGSDVPDPIVNGQGSLWVQSGDDYGFSWGLTSEASVPLAVLPGNYDVEYSLVQAGTGAGVTTVVPANQRTRIATVQLTASGTSELDVPVVLVERTTTVNGMAVNDATKSGHGDIVLGPPFYDGLKGGASLGETSETTTTPVLTGTYDVYYRPGRAGEGGAEPVPLAGARLRSGLALDEADAPFSLVVDIPTIVVDRTVTLNGSPLGDVNATGIGNLVLVRADLEGSVDWGSTSTPSLPRVVVPGRYDVFYQFPGEAWGTGPSRVPANQLVRVAHDLDLQSSGMAQVDLLSVPISVDLTVSGEVLDDTEVNGLGYLYLTDGPQDWIVLNNTYAAPTDVPVAPGTYDLVYSWHHEGSGTPQVPANEKRKLGCVVVTMP